MKALALALVFALVAIAQAFVLEPETVQAFRRAAEQSKAVTTHLDDGSIKVEIFTLGVYEGYVLESAAGAGDDAHYSAPASRQSRYTPYK